MKKIRIVEVKSSGTEQVSNEDPLPKTKAVALGLSPNDIDERIRKARTANQKTDESQ